MKFDQRLKIISTCLLLTLFAGCSSEVRREGLGGGALTPVKVTLLTDGGGGDSGGGGGAAQSGPKITEFGKISGKISVNGSLPNLAALLPQGASTKDAICSEQAVPNQTVVGENGGLGNVFVFLRRIPNVDVPEPPSDAVEMDQKGCVFEPHALVAQVGQPLVLKNSDPVAHNVHVKGFANTMNTAVQPNNLSPVETSFSAAERTPVPVVCDFHNWMAALVFPVDHPWATVSAMDGTFEIENVPAGKMEFVIWHETLGYIERSLAVDVPANGEANPIEISVDASQL